jgi:hypothetical protein
MTDDGSTERFDRGFDGEPSARAQAEGSAQPLTALSTSKGSPKSDDRQDQALLSVIGDRSTVKAISPPPALWPTGPVVGHPIRPRRLHAPFHQEINKERWRNSPPGGWAPDLRHPLAYPGNLGRPSRSGSPSRDLGQTRFHRVQAQLPSPSRRNPACLPRQRLQAPSDIAGSGGVPRQATAWETGARSVAFRFAGIVNTEGPRP